MKFPDKVYNVLKWLCLIALPAIGVFCSVVLPVIGVSDETTKIVTTVIYAVATLIGALIGVSTKVYNDSKK